MRGIGLQDENLLRLFNLDIEIIFLTLRRLPFISDHISHPAHRNRDASRRRMQLAAGVTLLAVIAIAALASTTSAQPTSMSGKVMPTPLVVHSRDAAHFTSRELYWCIMCSLPLVSFF